MSKGGKECWQFFFMVSDLDEDVHYMVDVSGGYGSPVDHIEGSWGSEFVFRQVVLACKILIYKGISRYTGVT